MTRRTSGSPVVRTVTGTALLVSAGALLLAGCSGSDGSPPAAAPAVTVTVTASTAPTPDTTGTPGSTTAGSTTTESTAPGPSASPGVFGDAAVTVARLGKVAIPTPGPTGVQPLATPGHLQLVAMGDTVVARPSRTSEAGIVALGPDLTVQPGPALANGRAPGTIAVTIRVTRGSVRLSPRDFVARDAYTHVTALSTTARPTVVRAGHSATLTFAGVFLDGGAVLEWAPAGGRLVVWDFHVEID